MKPHPARSRPWLRIKEVFPRITSVRHIADYRLELTFSDRRVAPIDLRDRILGRGGVFQRLEDVEFFRQVRVDPEAGTLVWPNGVDLCPDVLYSLATGVSIPDLAHA